MALRTISNGFQPFFQTVSAAMRLSSFSMRRALTYLCCALLFTMAEAAAQPAELPAEPPVRYDEDLLLPSFHENRRAAVLEALPENAVALFFSAPERNRENDVDFEYRQSSDLYYLTGTQEPETVLLLAPGRIAVDGERVRELLLVPPRTSYSDVWLGRRFGADQAQAELGLERAVSNERYAEIVAPLLENERIVVFHGPLPQDAPAESGLAEQVDLLLEHGGGRDLSGLLQELRMQKTEEELLLLQRAIDITTAAHREAMRSLEPGMHEYELEALIEYLFRRGGAEHPGFPSIVGSGENSVVLHYNTSRRRMEADDVVVIDIGAEYHGYTADVTRTLPVDGTFSPEQRAIYELVLRAQEAGIEAARAGRPFGAPDQAARRVIAEGLRELGLLGSGEDVQRFFMHGTSHYLGLFVHDVGDYGPLRPGQVITVEPGIYIRPAPDIDPKWWNIGVRIEDDILITEDAPVNLSSAAPRAVEEVERLMQERGLGNVNFEF